MSTAVAQAIEGHGALVAEAGTGTGKTFAYLVPALLWGGKVIISTGTRTLQDQLYHRDLPTVRAALRVPATLALLKGRANYVCQYRLRRTASEGRLSSRQDAEHLRSVVRFAAASKTGDRAEIGGVPEQSPIWPLVTSTRENCLGSECPDWRECFVMRARREAQQADLVVVNHHLFFADVMLREEGVTDLLPSANTLVFDEAHQLAETASLFFGETLSTAQLLELSRDAVSEGRVHARDAVDWATRVAPLEKAVAELRLALPPEPARLDARVLATRPPLSTALEALDQALGDLAADLKSHAERAEAIEQCWQRTVELAQKLSHWRDIADTETIHWIETFAHSAQLHTTPLSVADLFRRQREGSPRAWIFTSATLSVDGDFGHFANQLGLEDATSTAWASPFDFLRQALLYVPRDMPEPLESGYTQAVVDAALPLIHAAPGGTLFLCTTLRAVRMVAERLRGLLAGKTSSRTLLVQGEGSRSELLERFRLLGNAVLVGSQSFWEGIDVRGPALSLLIIDKLPFAPPDDPVLAARLEALARQGRNPFRDYQLPAAALALRQGAGRLIRDENDRGVLMICDPRFVTRSYGRTLWRSLPGFTPCRDAEEAMRFLKTDG